MLDAIGAHLESIHSYKPIDNQNISHRLTNYSYNRFVETKNIFENNNSTITEFNDHLKSGSLTVRPKADLAAIIQKPN